MGPDDPGQGGSGAKGDGVELVVDADADLLMELSAEQRAVEKATEVQEELDTVALENRALKEELHAAKVIVDKRAKKEELDAIRAGLEERIARARQQDDEWALSGGVRREVSEVSLALTPTLAAGLMCRRTSSPVSPQVKGGGG